MGVTEIRLLLRGFKAVRGKCLSNAPLCWERRLYTSSWLEDGPAWEKSSLLPTDIRPESYQLYLDPDIEGGTFNGKVSILINSTLVRDHILVHTKDLNITSTKLLNPSKSEPIAVKDSFEYKPNEFWVVRLENELTPGRYVLNLEFNGSLVNKIVGFYRSSYVNLDNVTRHIVSTKFEPTYARRAFPCFDEPAFKAVFNIELVKPSDGGYMALSNMNPLSEQKNKPSAGKTTVKFEPTPPMSTYLACVIVCDFDKLEVGVSQSGTRVGVYARQGQARHMLYARDLAVAAIDFYTNYFNIAYPLTKLDLIAIPDFVSGAMENWGLVTFRETSVLVKHGESSYSDYWRVSNTVCHEVAHMWFGNLVTMAWWDDLWLNEGFATFLAVKCGEKIKPQYNFQMMEVLHSTHSVLVEDGQLSSHPIIQTVSHPDQITEIFDAISYHKGFAVLYMLEDMSASLFREGVMSYLRSRLYGTARTDDLWTALQDVTLGRTDVTRVMGSWTRQDGYPLVTATRHGRNVTLTQRRFTPIRDTPVDPDNSPYKYKWDIPIVYFTSKDPREIQNILFDMDKDKIKIDLGEGVSWFKLNWRQVGFFRVNYDLDSWKEIIKVLKESPENMSWALDRGNLLDDSMALAKGGYVSYSVPLELITYLTHERHPMPWMVAQKHLSNLKNVLINTPIYQDYMNWARSVFEPIIAVNTWDVNSKTATNEMLRRVSMVSVGCILEIPAILEKASLLLDKFLNGAGDKPFIETRALVYKYGIFGDEGGSKWEKLWQMYLNETGPQDKIKMMIALAFSPSEETLNRLLELGKDENFVRRQDYISLLVYTSLNPKGNQVIWDFIRNNWEYLVERFTLNDRQLGTLIPRVVDNYASEEKLNEVKKFFSQYPDAGAGAAGRRKALESISNNIEWSRQHLDELSNYFKTHTK